MANNAYTDITLVVDRSGSMNDMREEAQAGVHSFIQKQCGGAGAARLTLVQFDDAYEFVHQGIPVEQAPPYVLVPRGLTALLDAVGRAINEVGKRLSSLPEAQRPGLVIFAIVTDGGENSSHEFTRKQVRGMIQHQRDVYKWQFIFLGVDDAAFDEARSIGVDDSQVARYARGQVGAAYSIVANKVCSARMSMLDEGEVASLAFSEAEREEMNDEEDS